MGFGDIGEVPGGTRGSGDTSDGDNDGGARRKHDAGVVGGLYCGERNHKRPVPYSPLLTHRTSRR